MNAKLNSKLSWLVLISLFLAACTAGSSSSNSSSSSVRTGCDWPNTAEDDDGGEHYQISFSGGQNYFKEGETFTDSCGQGYVVQSDGSVEPVGSEGPEEPAEPVVEEIEEPEVAEPQVEIVVDHPEVVVEPTLTNPQEWGEVLTNPGGETWEKYVGPWSRGEICPWQEIVVGETLIQLCNDAIQDASLFVVAVATPVPGDEVMQGVKLVGLLKTAGAAMFIIAAEQSLPEWALLAESFGDGMAEAVENIVSADTTGATNLEAYKNLPGSLEELMSLSVAHTDSPGIIADHVDTAQKNKERVLCNKGSKGCSGTIELWWGLGYDGGRDVIHVAIVKNVTRNTSFAVINSPLVTSGAPGLYKLAEGIFYDPKAAYWKCAWFLSSEPGKNVTSDKFLVGGAGYEAWLKIQAQYGLYNPIASIPVPGNPFK